MAVFGNKNKSMDQPSENKEINEKPVTSDKLKETEKKVENFDDCGKQEAKEIKADKGNAEQLKQAEDNFDDCEKKLDKMEEENPELSKEDGSDDFDDCGKEADEKEGRYVAEVTYRRDSEKVSQAEAEEELQEAYNDCENPEDMDELKRNINENEGVEAVDVKLVEKPEAKIQDAMEEQEKAEYEEAKAEAEEAKEELEEEQEKEEEFEEEIENIENKQENDDKLEDQSEGFDTELQNDAEEQVDETPEEAGEEPEETDEAKEEAEEATEETEEATEETEEATEETEEATEETEEKAEETDEEVEEIREESQAEVQEVKEEAADEAADTKIEAGMERATAEEEAEEAKEEAEAEAGEAKAETEEVKAEAEEAREEAEAEAEEVKEEAAEQVEEQEEKLAETKEETSEEIDEKAEEIVEENAEQENLTEEEMKEKVSEEVEENLNQETEEKQLEEETTEELLEEKKKEAEETVEEKQEEVREEKEQEKEAEEQEKEQEVQEEVKEELTFEQRMDAVMEKEDISEISSTELKNLREESAEKLEDAADEKAQLEADMKVKFDAVLAQKRGTEEYKESLKEYNQMKDEKNALDEKTRLYEQQKQELDEKTYELRNLQLEKGKEAVAKSEESLQVSSDLQDRYDEAYYDRHQDKKTLDQIQNESKDAISEMTKEKDAIKLAMDAKMDQISEYVTSHKMERYDTARDPYYKQLTEEYNALKDAHRRLDYNIVKLDENNKAISEVTGKDYESVQRRPKKSEVAEVNSGADIPGETDYFTDETRAKETLTPFKQERWEQLSVREQKRAIEKLADYNADILGVEDKPRIIYYNIEDPNDFGGFSEKQNAIYINEYNMNDAAETADTISHEYRHKYQHARAEKLENVRDLEYKNGFDHYIRPNDDYQAYKNQLVERDAREYADVIRAKIRELPDNGEVTPITEGFAPNKQEREPEKGALFEKVDQGELPDDFEKKIVEDSKEVKEVRKREVFEAAELQEIKNRVQRNYDNCKEVAQDIREFDTYKEHREMESGHIEKVHDKTLETADVLTEQFEKNNYGGMYTSNVDYKAVEMMAFYHDTGMDGNKTPETLGEVKKGDGDILRKNHSLESAVHVLKDREFIESKGVDADEVAMGCLLHSKSCSGVEDLEDPEKWQDAIVKLQTRVDEYNKENPENPIHFDSSVLLKEDGELKEDKLSQLRTEALCLRIGDSNGHDENVSVSQNGKEISYSLEKYEYSKDYQSWKDEVEDAEVYVDGKLLTDENDGKKMGRMFAVGEGNFKELHTEADENGNIREVIEVRDGNAFPYCTQKCIQERLEEFATAPSLDSTFVIKVGEDCDDDIFKLYDKFAGDMNEHYNIKVEIVK